MSTTNYKLFERWSVCLLPFPFTDRHVHKKRPALLINQTEYQKELAFLVVLMITSLKKDQVGWWNDYQILDLKAAGLPLPSIVRMKMFSIDQRLVLKTLGRLSNEDCASVQKLLHQCI